MVGGLCGTAVLAVSLQPLQSSTNSNFFLITSQDKPIERGNKEKKEEKIEIKQGKENQDPNQEVEAKKESLSNEEEDEVEWQKARGRSKKKGTTKIKLSVQKLDVKSDATNDSTTSCGSSQVAKDKPAPWKLENEKPKTGDWVISLIGQCRFNSFPFNTHFMCLVPRQCRFNSFPFICV